MNILVIFLILNFKKMFVMFPHCILILGFFVDGLYQIKETFHILILIINYINFIKPFCESNEMIIWMFPFNLLMWYMTYFLILNYICISGTNSEAVKHCTNIHYKYCLQIAET